MSALSLTALHHVAVIASDYQRSKAFYVDVLGFTLEAEYFRAERDSWMGKLSLNGSYLLELFSFPAAPERVSSPEALGLRHLAFAVADVAGARQTLLESGVPVEPLRTEPHTGLALFFFRDPDGLPLELYEPVRRADAV
ncbi:VOC family protein [Subtercola sp. YIM 133946]|uniref:VOC family protein n=1 Tax=Subtercola sp. YIM 133946 TaxID=3118909 RepID=UPI002F959CA0